MYLRKFEDVDFKRAVVLIGILLTALNLRTVVASISPIESMIAADIDLSATELGVLGALPPLAFALASYVTPMLVRITIPERLVLIAMVLMVLGNGLRSIAPGYWVLATGGLVALFAMGIGNTLLPPITKKYFSARVGEVTAAYMLLITLSAAIPAYTSSMLGQSIGWRSTLGLWGLLALVGVVPWLIFAITSRAQQVTSHTPTVSRQGEAPAPFRMIRSTLAWAIAGIAAVSSFNFFSVLAWLPQLLIQGAGVSAVEAGTFLGLYSLIAFPGSILVPIVVARLHKTNLIVVTSGIAMVVGYAGLLVAPTAVTWFWVICIGLGQMIFPLVLVLINIKTESVSTSARLSGFAQTVGYLSAAVGPLLIGVVLESTGLWRFMPAMLLISAFVVFFLVKVVSKYDSVEQQMLRR